MDRVECARSSRTQIADVREALSVTRSKGRHVSNRLAGEVSPYLLQHAENPVDWFPWGEEALQLAKEKDLPIFLSVGYAACHWCHVMAHESFEDPQTAAIMNRHFVNIKVDREERPDLDSLYMDAVVAMTGQGGWPMSVFMTPAGEPFYGGTYFPPTRAHGLPSFREVLLTIAQRWREDRQSLLQVGTKLSEHLSESPALIPADPGLEIASLESGAAQLLRQYDWNHGGWGQAPKFPQPLAIEFLLRLHARSGDRLALDMALHALKAMADSGLNDVIGGGFHRYCVDMRWQIPHFEKMLYDNAQLALAYLHAWEVTGDQDLWQVHRATTAFMMNEMHDAQGGFYASIDADSEGKEGRYYVWELEEVERLLRPDLHRLFIIATGISQAGNFEGANVLQRALDVPAVAEQLNLDVDEARSRWQRALDILSEARARRPRPATDDKVVASWNGLVLTTLAESARASGDADTLAAAHDLGAFLLEQMTIGGRLHRVWRRGRARVPAQLADLAAVGHGFLSLYQTDFDPRWFWAAVGNAEQILSRYSDPQGGFFDTADDQEQLLARPKSIQDSPVASSNTLAVTLMLEIGALTGEARFVEPAEKAVAAMQATAARHPAAFAGWLCALDFTLGPQLQLAVVGEPSSKGFRDLIEVTRKRFLPRLVIAGGSQDGGRLPALLSGRDMIDGQATAYLCQGFACRTPVTRPDALIKQINEA
jgi:uncharacterized protein YyaL (SSP411 family)